MVLAIHIVFLLPSGSKVDKFVYAREGSTITLPCELRGSGVEWVKDGRHSVTSHNGAVWLFQIDQSHEGEYTCSLNKDSVNYFVSVQGVLCVMRGVTSLEV